MGLIIYSHTIYYVIPSHLMSDISTCCFCLAISYISRAPTHTQYQFYIVFVFFSVYCFNTHAPVPLLLKMRGIATRRARWRYASLVLAKCRVKIIIYLPSSSSEIQKQPALQRNFNSQHGQYSCCRCGF